MTNTLARKHTFFSLLRFAMPNIVMMLFSSIYTIVDGIFVARFVGTDALSALNIVFPVISLELAVGIMFATGGSAIIAKKMGEGQRLAAKQDFSLIVLSGFLSALLIVILGLVFMSPILKTLGANAALFDYCREYLTILLYFAPLFMLQTMFQFFFVTVGKPNIGLLVILAGGFVNIILDYVFIVPLAMGIQGAALATGIGCCIPALSGLIYFSVERSGTLYFVRPQWRVKVLLRSCLNGASEMVTNLSTAVTTFLFNITMMRFLGENGVASITILLYSQYVFTAIYLGYSAGVAPIISYNYGAQDVAHLKRLLKMSLTFILITSALSFFTALMLGDKITAIFSVRGSAVFDLTVNGFYYFSVSFLFIGVNIFASAFFTALSDGKTSALISFMRTFVFIVLGILLLPLFFNVTGVWLTIPAAELLGIVVSLVCLIKKKEQYHYA